MYEDLADWWPLLSKPENYREEAEYFHGLLERGCGRSPRSVLELGSGGGNNASFLKRWHRMTLVDVAPGMLEVSRRLNPECEHVLGDMRTVRLGRRFDAVFVHDAVVYMTTEEDLRQVIETAFLHCRPGGVALFVPDEVRESFKPRSSHGGHDGEGRGLRYLEWAEDPDEDDTTYEVNYAIIVRESGKDVRVVHDRHVCGIFPKALWLRLLRDAGFDPEAVPEPYDRVCFLAHHR
jgi:SAM-dependent methyltransferase